MDEDCDKDVQGGRGEEGEEEGGNEGCKRDEHKERGGRVGGRGFSLHVRPHKITESRVDGRINSY